MNCASYVMIRDVTLPHVDYTLQGTNVTIKKGT